MKINFLLGLIFFGLNQTSYAQIRGCVDPSATNYYEKATVNDGSCLYQSVSINPISTFPISYKSKELAEMSGLEKKDSLWYTHNDNPADSFFEIRVVNDSIQIKRPIFVEGIQVVDWEELASDSTFFYMGDFGNNVNGARKDLKIIKVRKSFQSGFLTDSLKIEEILNFTYEDQTDFTHLNANKTNFDCEAMVVSDDSIYLFSKQWQSLNTTVYRLAKTGNNQIAKKIMQLPIDGLVTGAKLSPDKKKLALIGYSNLLQPFVVCIYGFQKFDFQYGCVRKLNLNMPFFQMEGICWQNDSIVSVVNEKFSNTFIQTNPSLQQYNLGFCWGKLENKQLGIGKFDEMNLKLQISPNPIKQDETLKLIFVGANRCVPVKEEIYVTNMKGQKLMTIQVNADRFELNHLVPGEYVIGNQKVGFVMVTVI